MDGANYKLIVLSDERRWDDYYRAICERSGCETHHVSSPEEIKDIIEQQPRADLFCYGCGETGSPKTELPAACEVAGRDIPILVHTPTASHPCVGPAFDAGVDHLMIGEFDTAHVKQLIEEQRQPGKASWTLYMRCTPDIIRNDNPPERIANLFKNHRALSSHHQTLYLIVTELFNNAVDHGLLELRSPIKVNDEGFMEYYEQRMRALEQLRTGHVDLVLRYFADAKRNQLLIRLHDTGAGFDSENHDADGLAQPFGRGIKLVKSLCESVEYRDGGRTVEAVYVPE